MKWRNLKQGAAGKMRQGVNMESQQSPYIVFHSTIVQLYTLCGGARIVTDDLDDLAVMCEHLRATEPARTGPDRLAESRTALEHAVADMFAALARYGWTASALPGGSLEQLEQENDGWQVLRRNANPRTIVGALAILAEGRKQAQERLRQFAAATVDGRLVNWVARVAVPITIDSNNRNRERCREMAARLMRCATQAAVIGLGLIETSREEKARLRAVPSSLPSAAMPGVAAAAAAEWAAFADFICADLRCDEPRLRVLVRCSICHAQACWHPRHGLAKHECTPRPGSYGAILDAALSN